MIRKTQRKQGKENCSLQRRRRAERGGGELKTDLQGKVTISTMAESSSSSVRLGFES